jgi:hypothetical protein
MATQLKPEDAQSRRRFITTAVAVVFATGIGASVILECWAGDKAVSGIDARKLAAIEPGDLQQVTFAALSMHPCLEANKSSTDDEKKRWSKVMSAVFPEGPAKLSGMGWVKPDESKGNYLIASDQAKLRLATAHAFAIRGSPIGQSKQSFGLYAAYIGNVPFEGVDRTGNRRGTSPQALFDDFFNSGGQLVFIKGGEKSLEAQARSWERDNSIRLRGGSTFQGVSVIFTPQPREVCCPDNGGVKISLIRRELDAAKIAAHGKGFVDVAMMKDAIRARYTALAGEKAEWQQAFYRNLKAELKPDPKLVARMDALDGMAGRNLVPEEAFLDAVLDVASESLTAQAYAPEMKFINGVHWCTLFLESSLPEAATPPFPGYEEPPRTKTTEAVNAVLAVKGTVVSKAVHDADMEAKLRQLSASFLKDSELKPELLSAIEEVFQGIFDALGQRRGEFLEALGQRQIALETNRVIQQVEQTRENYLANMAPFRKVDFVDAAYDGCVALEKALKEN